jgi:hypothetical protein
MEEKFYVTKEEDKFTNDYFSITLSCSWKFLEKERDSENLDTSQITR